MEETNLILGNKNAFVMASSLTRQFKKILIPPIIADEEGFSRN